MNKHIRNLSYAIGLVSTFGIAGTALADICPMQLQQDQQGYWYAKDTPGWKSHKATPHGVTLKAEDFGGVVYSPSRHRLACVYKASDGKWIALVSNVHHGISIDKDGRDDSGQEPAWLHSTKHNDFACGKPKVSHISGCKFSFEKQ